MGSRGYSLQPCRGLLLRLLAPIHRVFPSEKGWVPLHGISFPTGKSRVRVTVLGLM